MTNKIKIKLKFLITLIARGIKSNKSHNKQQYYIDGKWVIAGTLDNLYKYFCGHFLKVKFQLKFWYYSLSTLKKYLYKIINLGFAKKELVGLDKTGSIYKYELDLQKIKDELDLEFDENYNEMKNGKVIEFKKNPKNENYNSIFNPNYKNDCSDAVNNNKDFYNKSMNISSTGLENIENGSENIKTGSKVVHLEQDSNAVVSNDRSLSNLQHKTKNINYKNNTTTTLEEINQKIIDVVVDYLNDINNSNYEYKNQLIADTKSIVKAKIDTIHCIDGYIRGVVRNTYAKINKQQDNYNKTNSFNCMPRVAQELNYEQREYEDEELFSLYENGHGYGIKNKAV